MKAKIIETIEEAFFKLHPEVKPYYDIINLIKGLPSAGVGSPQLKIKTKKNYQLDAESSINLPQPLASGIRKPGLNLQTRVLSAVTELGKFVRLSEILTKIKAEDSKFSGSISPALTQLRQLGKLKNYMPTGNRKLTFWGLTEWELEGENK